MEISETSGIMAKKGLPPLIVVARQKISFQNTKNKATNPSIYNYSSIKPKSNCL